MSKSRRIKLHWNCLLLVLGFIISSCQTVSNTITPEPPVASHQTGPDTQDDVEKTEQSVPQISSAANETMTAKETVNNATVKSDEIEKKPLEELRQNMVEKWLSVSGHGSLRTNPVKEETTKEKMDKVTRKPAGDDKRSFAKQEIAVIGRWLNLNETESIEFCDDGTILIGKEEGSRQKLKGKYKFVDSGHLKVDFKGDLYASLIPPMSFKITVSENEITLIDEPDGTPTTYKRIK